MPAGPPLLPAALLVLLLLFLGAPARGTVYTNHFLVELHGGGQAEAERVAAEHGFGGVRKVSPRAAQARAGGEVRCPSRWAEGGRCPPVSIPAARGWPLARSCPRLYRGRGAGCVPAVPALIPLLS